ncbi:hypothetical protein [Campylobacter cuniculorum]|uniref:hypothetical protein n=1 Tax=Campylobacter cuniculorum TaxID=374106 RepID=UPI0023F4C831|nr:hypothetical protein [Campylobacter cuniculorum]
MKTMILFLALGVNLALAAFELTSEDLSLGFLKAALAVALFSGFIAIIKILFKK